VLAKTLYVKFETYSNGIGSWEDYSSTHQAHVKFSDGDQRPWPEERRYWRRYDVDWTGMTGPKGTLRTYLLFILEYGWKV
jgi:hypothetical protein